MAKLRAQRNRASMAEAFLRVRSRLATRAQLLAWRWCSQAQRAEGLLAALSKEAAELRREQLQLEDEVRALTQASCLVCQAPRVSISAYDLLHPHLI